MYDRFTVANITPGEPLLDQTILKAVKAKYNETPRNELRNCEFSGRFVKITMQLKNRTPDTCREIKNFVQGVIYAYQALKGES